MSKKLQSWKFIVLGFGLLGFVLVARAQGHGGVNQGEAQAPSKCGVLGVCNGGEKIFMYSCQDDNVVIRLCGEGSRFKIEDQKHCVGPERKTTKAVFKSFMRAQLDKTELHGKLGEITKEDLDAAKSDGDLRTAKSCEAQIEGEIANLRNKLSLLQGAISQAVKADIEGQIKSQEGALVGAKAKTKACENKQAALKKIETQIENAVNTVCARNGIYVPQEGSFLHSVLSQYDPSKHTCSTEKDCNTPVKLANGTVVGALVSRSVNDKGVVEEFVKDKASKLTWSPEAPTTMNHKDAEAYCAAKKDLGLKWSLPSDEDFRVAFNPQNPDKDRYAYNKNLLEALDTKDRFLWSSSVHKKSTLFAWGFYGHYGYLYYHYRDFDYSVRCVGR
jgi:hypothetical protein